MAAVCAAAALIPRPGKRRAVELQCDRTVIADICRVAFSRMHLSRGNAVGKRLFHCAIHGMPQFARSVRALCFTGKRLGQPCGMPQPIPVFLRTLFESVQHCFRDAAQIFFCQRVEYDHFVKSSEQFGAEKSFALFPRQLRLFFPQCRRACSKAERTALPCKMPCAEV